MATEDEHPPAQGAPAAAAAPSEQESLPIRSHPTAGAGQDGTIDIVETYYDLLRSDPDISMAVAAIEALIAVLGSTRASTAMETVDVVRAQADRLKRSVRNPVPLTAGTDLFQQYLMRSLRGQTAPGLLGFDETRHHLLANSRVFVSRAKAARDAIAERGSRYVVEGETVLAAGGSRTVKKLLLRAAERHVAARGVPQFKVIYVMDGSRDSKPAVEALRAAGVPTAEVDPSGAAFALQAARVTKVFVGAEAVLQNGGVLSRMGTFQLATVCAALGVKFYVAAETHKIVRKYPLGQRDLKRIGVQQDALDFRTAADDAPEPSYDATVDYTPPDIITSLITEQGIKNATQVYEMILDIFT